MKSSNAGRILALTASMHQTGASKTAYTRLSWAPWHPTIAANVREHRTVPRVDCGRVLTRCDGEQQRHRHHEQIQAYRDGESAVKPVDMWTVLRTGGLAVDNNEAVIHRARLCSQAPLAPNYFVGKAKPATTTPE